MNNEKSYTEISRTSFSPSTQADSSQTEDLLIDMMIYEAQLTFTKEQLKLGIDLALDNRDEEQFMKLSSELIELTKKFGT